MTLEEIEGLSVEVLTCTQVGPVLRASPATIHEQARERPELLGFPVIVIGSRVRIPKRAFIEFMKGKKAPAAGTAGTVASNEAERDTV